MSPQNLKIQNLKSKIENSRGFTLLESMIVIAIFSVIFLTVLAAFDTGNRTNQYITTKARLQDQMRSALDRMIREIHPSSSTRVTISTQYPNQHTCNFFLPQSVSSSGQITWSNTAIRYFIGGLNNAQLIRQDLGTNQTTVLANEVQGLQFTGNPAQNPKTVTIRLTAQGTTPNQRVVQEILTGQVQLKN